MQPIEQNSFSCFVFSTCKENKVSFHWLINYKSVKDNEYYFRETYVLNKTYVDTVDNQLIIWKRRAEIRNYFIYDVFVNELRNVRNLENLTDLSTWVASDEMVLGWKLG